jgi:hypothetical protein
VLAEPLEATLVRLARSSLGTARPDLVLLATTKADLDVWCESLLRAPRDYIGGPAELASRLGRALGAPAYAVSAACASSPLACGVAARAIASGRARRVLVLAGDRLGAFVRDGFAGLKAIDPVACRPFDAQRAGLALGETAAAVLLEDGEGDLHLAGWGASLDANHLTGPSRDGAGLARACGRALWRAAESAPALVIGHGTGTRYNDDSESLAYAAVCAAAPVVGYKGLLGHSLGACGLTELAVAAASLRAHRAPGTVGLDKQGCAGAIRVLPPGEHPLAAGPILCANAGFGGINGATLVAMHPAPAVKRPARRMRSRIDLDADGWRRGDASGSTASGAWEERGDDGLPKLTSREVLGRVEPNWGRMDLACRALVALGKLGPALPETTSVVLLTEAGCAATDRAFERARRERGVDPQRFAYTLPTTPIGEASIRLGLRGAGVALLGASDAQGREAALDLAAESGAPVLLARVEADDTLSGWAELWEPTEER